LARKHEGHRADALLLACYSLAVMNGAVVATVIAAGLGSRIGVLPRPISMWKNQRRERAMREAVEATGIPLDFNIKLTWLKNGKTKIVPFGPGFGWSKWEVAHLLLIKYEGAFIVGEEKKGLFGRRDDRCHAEMVKS
jgi:hypothetical protein